MASVGSNACANVDGSLGNVCGADDESSLRRGWDGLAMPAKDETGRVCQSPISPILARAFQFLDEMPDSGDSGGNAEEYVEDEESLAEEELQSACRSEPFRSQRGACPSRISLAAAFFCIFVASAPCSARNAPFEPHANG
jgi:hypothetical protein